MTVTGFDVPAVLDRGDEHELWAVHQAADAYATWERAADATRPAPPLVTPLEALAVTHRLAEALAARRWAGMRRAREHGATWRELGDALGMTKQAAQEWYRKTAERHHARGLP